MHADSTSPPPARVRAGGKVLSLLATPLCVPILRAHMDGPLRLPDLRDRIGGAAQTTLRGQVSSLRGIGALERRVGEGMPYTVENELTDIGRGILEVADIAEAWLARAPQGAIVFGSEPAKGAIKALVGGWSSTVLRVLAAEPLSLTELDSVISELSYPSLERRLSAMRAARQVEVRVGGAGAAKPYAVTNWTRQAVGPLVAAGRCECRYLTGMTDPLTRIDIEAAFLLAIPLVELPASHRHGSCLLAVDRGAAEGDKSGRRLAGVHVEVDSGTISACVPRLERNPRTWALGTVGSWVNAILEGQLDQLRMGGEDPELARATIAGLHTALFAV